MENGSLMDELDNYGNKMEVNVCIETEKGWEIIGKITGLEYFAEKLHIMATEIKDE